MYDSSYVCVFVRGVESPLSRGGTGNSTPDLPGPLRVRIVSTNQTYEVRLLMINIWENRAYSLLVDCYFEGRVERAQ